MFDTYTMIDPGSQFAFLLDKVTTFLELPCEAQASTTLQYLNTEHEMPLSKISGTVTVTPYNKINQHFSIARAYSTPCLSVSHNKVHELNQWCDTFKELSHIYFTDIANGAIGALPGVNTFAFTYPVDVIQGSKKRPFGVKIILVRLSLESTSYLIKQWTQTSPRANHSFTMSAGKTLKKNNWTNWFKDFRKQKLKVLYPNRMKTAH